MKREFVTTVRQFFTSRAIHNLEEFEAQGGTVVDVDEYGASLECPVRGQGECLLGGQFIWFDRR